MPVKSCEVCGTEFNARLSRIRTCSVQCRNRLIASEKEAKHKQTKVCEVCSTEFEVGADDKNKRTCSAECGYKLRASMTSRRIKMTCATCHGVFDAVRSQVEAGGGKYCSKTCMYERNKAETTRPCACCGKEFSTPPSQAHVKTCSTECGYKLSGGENKPNYKGVTELIVIDGKKVSRRTRAAGRAHSTKRRAGIARATPSWASQEKIDAVYKLASDIEAMTGVPHATDHVVPLNNPMVCGLHVEHNLQVLTREENAKKGNRHWPDMW